MIEETGRSMPAEQKPRKKPRQPDSGSDGAGVRRQKITETEEPVSADSPEQGRKEQIPDGVTDVEIPKPPVKKKKKRPATGDESISDAAPKKRPVSAKSDDGQPQKRPASKTRPENRKPRPAAETVEESTEESSNQKALSLKKPSSRKKQLPAKTDEPVKTEVALIPKPADREIALIRSTGLTAEEVQYRVQQGEVNVTVPKGQKSVGRIVASHTAPVSAIR